LLVKRTTQRNGVDLAAESLIPASNDQTGTVNRRQYLDAMYMIELGYIMTYDRRSLLA
jgi:hypothetical protein